MWCRFGGGRLDVRFLLLLLLLPRLRVWLSFLQLAVLAAVHLFLRWLLRPLLMGFFRLSRLLFLLSLLRRLLLLWLLLPGKLLLLGELMLPVLLV